MKRELTLILLFSFWGTITLAQSLKNISGKAQFYIKDSGRILNNPPFQNCHAVTIVETNKDTLLYAWFGGDYEGAKNVSIWGCYRCPKQKKQWGKLLLLAKGQDSLGNEEACWNPVLSKTFDGLIFLDYKVGTNPREWRAERKTSYNNGKTWSPPERLLSPFLGPIKNKPLQLKSGTILYPSSTESQDEKSWRIHVERTDAAGHQWQYISIDCGNFDVIQPSILKYGDSSLQMLCRSKQNAIIQTCLLTADALGPL